MSDLVAAFMLLTRLPVAWLAPATPRPFAASVWAYPVVGAAVGALMALAFALARTLALPPALASVWTLAVGVLVTGGLHEDGLADTADGLGGGRTRERKLEIMRDSRIGGFGALALILSLAARGGALALIADAGTAAAALVVSGALGRGGIVLLLLWLRPARPDGLAAGLVDTGRRRAAVGLALAAGAAFALLGAAQATLCVAAAAVATLAVGAEARRQLGGYTGDVLGAASVLAECAVLSVLARST